MKLPELIKNVVGSADEHQAFMHNSYTVAFDETGSHPPDRFLCRNRLDLRAAAAGGKAKQ
jgi:hypothetical protein